jgi:site-specific DNA recombinase
MITAMPQPEAVIYCRASKDKTGAGLSVAGQEADCRNFAGSHGLAVRHVYADNDITASGRKTRPAYRQMLADLAGRPAVVIVWHTDRLHRHLAELEEYITLAEEHGITTRAVRAGDLDLTTASGRMIARMLGVAARHELEQMSERRKAGKARAAANGQWKGGRRPFGYASDGVTIVPAEAALIAAGSDAVLAGSSLAAITRTWNTSGIATTTGKAWRPREVARVLLRPRNAALMEHQGQILEGVSAEWPPVVEEPVWRGVAAALSAPGRRTTPGPARVWLLSGIAECGVCGRGLLVSRVAGKGRPMRPVYRCRPERASGAQGHLARDAAALEEYITEVVLARLARPDAAQLLRPAPAADGAAQLHTRVAAARQRLDQAAGMFAGGQIDASQLATVTSQLNAELSAATHKLASLSRQDALAAFRGRDPASVWAGLDLDRRRAVVSTLMRVIVEPAPRGRPRGWRPGSTYFDPDRIRIDWRR